MAEEKPSSSSQNGITIPGTLPGNRIIRRVAWADLPIRQVGPRHFVAELAESQSGLARLWVQLRRFLIGRPLHSAEAHSERIGKAKALAIFSADALSSTAYATEESLRILVLAGSAASAFILPIGLAIVLLLAIVVFSYRKTIRAYPHGGGTYIVTRGILALLPRFWPQRHSSLTMS